MHRSITSRRWIWLLLLAGLALGAVDFFAVHLLLRSQIPTSDVRPIFASQEVDRLHKLPGEADELEQVTSGGQLSKSDYEAIRQIVATHDRLFEKNIIGIQVDGPDRVEVTTGPKDLKPLDGGGDILTLQKGGGKWFVVELGSWIG